MRRNLLEFTLKLRALTPSERRFALRAWTWAPVVEASLAWRGLQPTLSWIERAFRPKSRTQGEPPPLARGRWLVDAVYTVHVVRGTCLPRALLLYALMRSAGRADVTFVIGVAKDFEKNQIAAHAWAESAREPAPETDPRFEPLLVRVSGP